MSAATSVRKSLEEIRVRNQQTEDFSAKYPNLELRLWNDPAEGASVVIIEWALPIAEYDWKRNARVDTWQSRNKGLTLENAWDWINDQVKDYTLNNRVVLFERDHYHSESSVYDASTQEKFEAVVNRFWNYKEYHGDSPKRPECDLTQDIINALPDSLRQEAERKLQYHQEELKRWEGDQDYYTTLALAKKGDIGARAKLIFDYGADWFDLTMSITRPGTINT